MELPGHKTSRHVSVETKTVEDLVKNDTKCEKRKKQKNRSAGFLAHAALRNVESHWQGADLK